MVYLQEEVDYVLSVIMSAKARSVIIEAAKSAMDEQHQAVTK